MPARSPNIASAADRVGQFILVVRRQRVLLDEHLARLYGVETRSLLQAVKRNLERFPPDFMFELSAAEWAALRSQSVTSKAGRGGRRYAPYAFTEQGAAMLSSVLNSNRAIAGPGSRYSDERRPSLGTIHCATMASPLSHTATAAPLAVATSMGRSSCFAASSTTGDDQAPCEKSM